jgi:hypothetical protein
MGIYMCVCVCVLQGGKRLSSGMTGVQVVDLSARYVSWGSNDAVTLLYFIAWSNTSA